MSKEAVQAAVVATSGLGLGESASVVGSHSPGPRGRGGVLGALSRLGMSLQQECDERGLRCGLLFGSVRMMRGNQDETR